MLLIFNQKNKLTIRFTVCFQYFALKHAAHSDHSLLLQSAFLLLLEAAVLISGFSGVVKDLWTENKDKDNDLWLEDKDNDLWLEDKDKDLQISPRGQGLSSRTTTLLGLMIGVLVSQLPMIIDVFRSFASAETLVLICVRPNVFTLSYFMLA